MTLNDAVLRICQEIYLFTDRPEYVCPKAVQEALDYLGKTLDIKTNSYPPDEEDTREKLF